MGEKRKEEQYDTNLDTCNIMLLAQMTSVPYILAQTHISQRERMLERGIGEQTMRDNEIIKALICCSNQAYFCNDEHCFAKTLGDAIDLINRQKAEIETLKMLLSTSNVEMVGDLCD